MRGLGYQHPNQELPPDDGFSKGDLSTFLHNRDVSAETVMSVMQAMSLAEQGAQVDSSDLKSIQWTPQVCSTILDLVTGRSGTNFQTLREITESRLKTEGSEAEPRDFEPSYDKNSQKASHTTSDPAESPQEPACERCKRRRAANECEDTDGKARQKCKTAHVRCSKSRLVL